MDDTHKLKPKMPITIFTTRNPTYYKRKKRNDFLTSLPIELLIEILSWLPARAVYRCKCVSKTWLDILSDPKFVALHFTRARTGLIIHQAEMFKDYIKLVEFHDKIDGHDLDNDSLVKFDLKRLSEFSDANIVLDGSVNGLLCLRDNYEEETVFVCNPVTREYVKLPGLPEWPVRYPSITTYGFGVSRVSGQYKVVRVFHDQVIDPIRLTCVMVPWSACHVYTLGSRSWRTVTGNLPNFAYGARSRTVGLFFNGNIHWLIKDLDESHELISCFDLETEVFKPFPAPFPARRDLLGSLGVLKNRLCLVDNSSHFEINIWMMKEYGVEKSWAKEFVIGKMPELIGTTFEVVYPLKVFQNGVIMVCWGDFFMMYCKDKNGREVDIDQPRGPNGIEAMLHVSSLVSLRNLGLENVRKF